MSSVIAEEPQTELRDITQHEIIALRTRYNLADAHTHQRQSKTQQEIVSQLPRLWYESEELTQHELEQRFIHRFFELQGQPTALKLDRALLAYAASIVMFIATTFCMQRRLSISLIEPCFDNLHDLIKNLQVPRIPLHEELFYDVDKIRENLENATTGDVLCLVDPNNPTGFTLLQHGRRGFQQVVDFCRDHNKILMLDLSFVSFVLSEGPLDRFDLYEMLEESGITYIVMEDTGKVWPVQDAKCAILMTSEDIYQEVYDIHTSVLLNVSPFILNMLSEYLSDSRSDALASVKNTLNTNRQVAVEALEGSALEYQKPAAPVSVAWFKITDPNITASKLQEAAYEKQVYVLPGTYFYWSRPEAGERYVRLALARQPEVFAPAVQRLREVVDELSG
ncbi:aminotransferase class I/II-fold pyridoxal phosphate-dependent enzyme [Ferruginivarius sediminum]|uniref:Aminotransferase class I/II-fold pyridoxal phosphate-dependent enzyme n=1 Tax=Ferruginivarius sediminum TaxID=2661937 RepID=A0A369T9R9_9PROT|nr:aminotransferase class I/II-fold pyridoxal phosphate-dependent enzyme [Ferruginivarius sediminum]RDD62081.1 aminotransferase class I/II-fold pyridoxal phosphate-dependent enzyme [Ferruginivarius sediminum]